MIEKILAFFAGLKTNEKLMYSGIVIALGSVFTTQQSFIEIRPGYELYGVGIGGVLFFSGLLLKVMWIRAERRDQGRAK